MRVFESKLLETIDVQKVYKMPGLYSFYYNGKDEAMAQTESVIIKVPIGMSKYRNKMNPESELIRNIITISGNFKPNHIPRPSSRNFGNPEIRTD